MLLMTDAGFLVVPGDGLQTVISSTSWQLSASYIRRTLEMPAAEYEKVTTTTTTAARTATGDRTL